MKQVYKIDKNGYFVEDVILKEGEETPANCIEERPPQPMYKARWTGSEWVDEGVPPEPSPELPTIDERLQALELMELERILGGM